MDVWLSACLASLLTGGIGFGGIWWQHRRSRREAAAASRAELYRTVISRSLACATRAQTLRLHMRSRSGLKEGFDVTFRVRRAVDVTELHDWLAQDFSPLTEAWASIQLLSDTPAVQHATDKVIKATTHLLDTATEIGLAHDWLTEAVRGMAWTAEQERSMAEAVKTLMDARNDFIDTAQADLAKLGAGGLANGLKRLSAQERPNLPADDAAGEPSRPRLVRQTSANETADPSSN